MAVGWPKASSPDRVAAEREQAIQTCVCFRAHVRSCGAPRTGTARCRASYSRQRDFSTAGARGCGVGFGSDNEFLVNTIHVFGGELNAHKKKNRRVSRRARRRHAHAHPTRRREPHGACGLRSHARACPGSRRQGFLRLTFPGPRLSAPTHSDAAVRLTFFCAETRLLVVLPLAVQLAVLELVVEVAPVAQEIGAGELFGTTEQTRQGAPRDEPPRRARPPRALAPLVQHPCGRAAALTSAQVGRGPAHGDVEGRGGRERFEGGAVLGTHLFVLAARSALRSKHHLRVPERERTVQAVRAST